jgi:hypothetical protein
MNRSFAAVVTVVAACTSIGLATAPAYARPVAPKSPQAALTVTPKWTYEDGGKFAVTAKCAAKSDLRIVFSPLLYHPVTVPGAGDLLIRVTGKTKPGKYTVGLMCVDRHAQADAIVIKTVTVRKKLDSWPMAAAPALPRHFKASLTVQTGMRQVIVPAQTHRSVRATRHAAKHR